MSHIVIIGSGHAGLTLAREIRSKDTHCQVTLLSKESVCAYYKPNLSKALSSGKTPDQLIMKTAEKLSAELNIHIISQAEVTNIKAAEQSLSYQVDETNTVHTLHYDKLVLATGASPVLLPNTIASPKHVLNINNLRDYQYFRTKLEGKQSIAIIGAGYIGCELASDLSSQGITVHLIDRGTWPLSRAVPQAIGSVIQQEMTKKNAIKWHLGKTLERIEKNDQQVTVNLTSGEKLDVDLVLSAIGLQANIHLATLAGADTAIGIKVNSFSQTSIHNIFALGDCAEYHGKLLPFIAPITQAAKALASTLTTEAKPLIFSANAVPVKISACPTVICPSSENSGIWEVQGSGQDLEAHFLNEFGELTGFALTGKAVSKKMALLKRCHPMALNLPNEASVSERPSRDTYLSKVS